MSSISYVRAGISCLPIIGPFVAYYNVIQVKNELFNPLINALTQLNLSMTQLKDSLPLLSGKKESLDVALQDIETKKKKLKDRFIPIIQKGRFYSLCGVVGNIVSVITAVALASMGILVRSQAIFLGVNFTLHAFLDVYVCYLHHRDLNILQSL